MGIRRWARGLALLWLAAGSSGLAAQDEPASGDATAELRALYEADQSDRSFTSPPEPGAWEWIQKRDAERKARVYDLLRAGRLAEAQDFYHAAMILQHGTEARDVLLAHVLATAAAFRGDDRGRWLSAAALDRYLHRTRTPQLLGTQYIRSAREDPYRLDPDQPWSQGPYTRWLPDALREIYDVIPLAEQEDRVRSMNGAPSGSGPLSPRQPE